MKQHTKTGGLDGLRLAAALLVVAIHTAPLASYSTDADFFLTRVLARVAVPFFFMVTGYFLLSPVQLAPRGSAAPLRPVWRFVKKTLLLYGAAVVLYLPLNLYAGHFAGAGVGDVLRLLVFDGTFYHLWYLPACVLGVLLVVGLRRTLPLGGAAALAAALYAVGLLGDSYYGATEGLPLLRGAYEAMFGLFSYTRGGIFYAPIFLLLGAACARLPRPRGTRAAVANGVGALLSLLAMTAEAFALRGAGWPRHDSMYVCLPLCAFFCFRLALGLRLAPRPGLRGLSTWVYVLHPLCIVAVRGAAKLTQLQGLLVENSLVHYLAVCALSCLAGGGVAALAALCATARAGKDPTARAWAELNHGALRHNVQTLTALLPADCALMPAVKADAYGHGAVLVARALNQMGVRAFCVACAAEGAQLRRNGVRGEILVLGYTHPTQLWLLRRWRLTQTVVDSAYADTLHRYGKHLRVHLCVDTGMHRLGEACDELEALARIFTYRNLHIEGIFTHLCADETTAARERAFTLAQANALRSVAARLEKRGCHCGKLHLVASYGVLNYPQLGGSYARVGIALYGTLGCTAHMQGCAVQLQPVLSVKARVAAVKPLRAGETAGYGLQFIAPQPMRVAVLAIGYADGLPRAAAQGGHVLLHGVRARILCVCMDQTIVDATEADSLCAGEVATILGGEGAAQITACELAAQAGTITNEILSRLGARLPRRWADGAFSQREKNLFRRAAQSPKGLHTQ